MLSLDMVQTVAFAGAVLFAGYVVGPFIGHRLQAGLARTLIAVDDALVDITTEGAP